MEQKNIVGSEHSSWSRQQIQSPHLPYWLNIGHILEKMQVEASTLFCYRWTFRFLLPSVGIITQEEIQQPKVPAPMVPVPTSSFIYLIKVANWDGKSQDIDQVLTAAFNAEDYLDCIRDLQAGKIEPLSYINSLDKVCSHLSFN